MRIATAARRLELAKRQMLAAVEEAFPVGSRVSCVLGGNLIYGHIEEHGSWWHEPQMVRVRNERTMKLRSASATGDSLRREDGGAR